MPRRWAVIGQACVTVVSLWLAERILHEPFVRVVKSEVWTLVALPAFLACLQAQVTLILGVSLVRRSEKRFRMALLFAWSVLSLWFLVFVPRAYVGRQVPSRVHDITDHAQLDVTVYPPSRENRDST